MIINIDVVVVVEVVRNSLRFRLTIVMLNLFYETYKDMLNFLSFLNTDMG